MKKLNCLTLALLMLSGCVALEEEAISPPATSVSPSETSTAAVALSPSPTAELSSAQSPTLQPSPFPTLQPPFPDIVFSDDLSANSGAKLYEDDENIYYCDDYLSLFQICKSNGKTTTISESCFHFTLLKGIVYYVTCGKDEVYNTIAQYDPSTGKSKTVLRPGNDIFEITAYGNKLYFSYATEPMPYADPEPTDLYSCKPDGSNMKMVRADVFGFCIVGDRIYYTLGSCNDDTPLYTCALDGSSAKELYDCIDWAFDAEGTWLYVWADCSILRNLSSCEEIVLPGCDACVLAGQYAFYVTSDALPALCALDLNTRITYTLVQLPEGYYGLEATGQAIYLCDNTGAVSRISVQSGTVMLDVVLK